MKILITGGAGYIGSHTAVSLLEKGYEVVIVDNFCNSHQAAIAKIEEITGKSPHVYAVDLCDKKSTSEVFAQHTDIQAIIHFAALKAVGESTEIPLWYFENNMKSMLNVLSLAKEYDIKHFIFSSSCTVYGHAEKLPVDEQTPMQEAESPYGRTKQLGEYMLQDLVKYSDLNVVSLRYFNPAGAHHSGLLGESSKKVALNLVPVITETAAGKRKECVIFGDDYDTRDGTCIRDYIHIEDLADAHVKAVEYATRDTTTKGYHVFNLGIGDGVSVLEAIQAFEKVSGQKLNYRIGPRRAGDVVAIYSTLDKAQRELQWTPSRNIDDIMRSAWQWEQNRPF